jgi:hypothetical protein
VVIRLLETIHGHFGVLAAAALLHPAILMRKGKALSFRGRLSVFLTTAMVAGAFITGLVIYAEYRTSVRTGLFHHSVTAGLLFETKEHIAYGVLATTLGACACALLAPREATALRRVAALFYGIAAALCLLTVCLGSYVASVHGFGAR